MTNYNIDGDEPLVEDVKANLEPLYELGKLIMSQFRSALLHKNSMRVGDYTLKDLLVECKNARDDTTSCKEHELRENYPQWAAMPVSIVAFKVNILVSLIRESLIDVASAPFIVEPTPVPEIPDAERLQIDEDMMTSLVAIARDVVNKQRQVLEAAAQQGVDANAVANSENFPRLTPDVVEGIIHKLNTDARREVVDLSVEQAHKLEKALYDKTLEGGYKRAIMAFADDFATYPFACLHGAYPELVESTVWDKDKFKTKEVTQWSFERVSPFDLFWTEDSTNTQDGTAVFIRKRVSYDYLYDIKRIAETQADSGFILSEIEDLIDAAHDNKLPRTWVEFDTNPEMKSNLTWKQGDSVELLIRYGRFTGHALDEIGIAGLEQNKMYETKTIMCAGHLLLCLINKNPGKYKRPVFTASFESRNNSIVGVGLGQKLLSIHKAYRSVINLAMYNLGLSSEPITELEVTRTLEYLPDDWISNPTIKPGMVIPTDGDRLGNGSRAVKFTQIPNTTASALQFAEYIFNLSHTISNIPAALHGQPVGSGANRTVRGLLTLQGNTLKPIQSALINLDLGVIEPMITLLYMLLVMYDNDFKYSGDCKIVAKGAASMVQREMDKQSAMEVLQLLGQLGSVVNPEIINRQAEKVMHLFGAVDYGETAVNGQVSIEPQGGQQQQEQAQPRQ